MYFGNYADIHVHKIYPFLSFWPYFMKVVINDKLQ